MPAPGAVAHPVLSPRYISKHRAAVPPGNPVAPRYDEETRGMLMARNFAVRLSCSKGDSDTWVTLSNREESLEQVFEQGWDFKCREHGQCQRRAGDPKSQARSRRYGYPHAQEQPRRARGSRGLRGSLLGKRIENRDHVQDAGSGLLETHAQEAARREVASRDREGHRCQR